MLDLDSPRWWELMHAFGTAEDIPGVLRRGIRIQAVHDPPRLALISNPQLMAAGPNTRHWPRVRQQKHLVLLQPATQNTGFDSCRGAEGRRLHLAVQPHQEFVSQAHGASLCRIRHARNGCGQVAA